MIENAQIGIVVLNYNSYDLTCSLTKRVIEMGSVDYVAIIDNDSKDDFSEFATTSPKILYQKARCNKGYASGNNIGLRMLSEKKCDIAFIANPDVEFNEDAVTKITNFLISHEDYAVASCSRVKGNNILTGQYWWIPDFKYTVLEATYLGRRYLDKKTIRLTNKVENHTKKRDFLKVEVVGGAFFGMKLSILAQMNYLDENTFLWYEENILSFRLRQLGYKVGFLKDCQYIHNHKKTGHGNPNIDIFFDSKKYYCRTYLKVNRVQQYILNCVDCFGALEEKMLYKIFNLIKKR